MAQNISLTNTFVSSPETNDLSYKNIETCNRPILVQYIGAGTPYTRLVEIQVYKVDGAVQTKVGAPLIKGRDGDSDESTPVFTFDISSVLKSIVEKGDDVGIFSQSNGYQGIDRGVDFKIIQEYKVKARSWYIDANTDVLTVNDTDDEIETVNGMKVCDIYIHDEEENKSKHVNMLPSQPKLSGWNMNTRLVNADATFNSVRFLTNCPIDLRRKIPAEFPMTASVFSSLCPGLAARCVCKFDNGVTGFFALTSAIFFPTNSSGIKTLNLTVDDTHLLGNTSLATMSGMTGSNIDISLTKSGSQVSSPFLKFEIIDIDKITNTNFKQIRNAKTIYFVNDYNCFDFYTFESNLGVSHTNIKNTFKSGVKDFTKRESSNFGVSRGKTEEVYTLSSIVNKETSCWLSEIYRSVSCFIYEKGSDGVYRFCPIRVIDADTVPLPQERTTLEQFSISFIKDTYIVKR